MKPINPSELFDTLVAVASGAVAENGDVDAASGAAATQTLDILLVEDSLYNQRLAQGVLSKMGHRVTVAETGTQAVEAHRRRRFDLILMDVQMPEMDGLEATRRIRAREAGSGDRVPIIAMTAQALKGDRERCLESGMDDYLAKPVRAAELRAKIQEVAGAEATRTLPASGSLDACDPAHPSRAGSLDACDPAHPSRAGSLDGRTPPAPPRSAVAADFPEARHVDWAIALNYVGNDPSLLELAVEAFLEECPVLLRSIQEGAREQESARVRIAAHSLKNAMRTLGAEPAHHLAAELEDRARRVDLKDLDDLVRELEDHVRGVREDAQALLRKELKIEN
jgi:CheY-like chemotaxis protein/HPt (histidine-containing phosphotransfer) domain-containing protein